MRLAWLKEVSFALLDWSILRLFVINLKFSRAVEGKNILKSPQATLLIRVSKKNQIFKVKVLRANLVLLITASSVVSFLLKFELI